MISYIDRLRVALAAIASLVFALSNAQAAAAPPLAIYQFKTTDLAEPGYLTQAPDGVLFGESNYEVFELIPPAGGQGHWQKQKLWRFPANSNAAGPVVRDKNGSLFGETTLGGVDGDGFAFELSPPTQGGKWTRHIIYTFPDGIHGAQPKGGLILARDGALYGTNGLVVFRLTSPASGHGVWTETTLTSFNGIANPVGANGPLLLGPDGSLFGTTQHDGTAKQGTAYRLSPPAHGQGAWTLTTLFNFTGAGTGVVPGAGLIADSSGALYGTTMNNGGTAFRLNPPAAGQSDWTMNVLWVFKGAPDCQDMKSPLVRTADGTLYGIAPFGGDVSPGLGCAFRLNPPAAGQTSWTETILWNFDGGANDGYLPNGNLVLTNHWLYGVSEGGGAYLAGVAFKLRP